MENQLKVPKLCDIVFGPMLKKIQFRQISHSQYSFIPSILIL